MEFLKEEIREKNYIIRSLLNQINVILQKSMTKNKESCVETSSEFPIENVNENLLINLNDGITNQNNLKNSQLDNAIGINVSLSTQDEISINEQHNDREDCNNTYDEIRMNEQLITI